jgi:DNA-binding response OmpR family regulator
MQGPRPLVLVVDDDTSLRLLARVNLELEGFVVQEAANSDEARRVIAETRPDVVLLDVHLGGVTSGDLLDELRAASIPVALVTGTAELEELRGRADDVLVKPFLPESLTATARRLATVRDS